MPPSEHDIHQSLALALLATIVALVTAGSLALALHQQGLRDAPSRRIAARTVMTAPVMPSPMEAPTLAPAAIVLNETTTVRQDGSVLKFFFATGTADLPGGSTAALLPFVQAASAGQALRIRAYHHDRGDLQQQAKLMQARMQAVRQALLARGVPARLVEVAALVQTPAAAGNEQASRVEVLLAAQDDVEHHHSAATAGSADTTAPQASP